jgi:hypothetical protein
MTDNNNDKTMGINKFNPDDHMKSERPLIYHVYNNKRIKSFQNYLPFFFAPLRFHYMLRTGKTPLACKS